MCLSIPLSISSTVRCLGESENTAWWMSWDVKVDARLTTTASPCSHHSIFDPGASPSLRRTRTGIETWPWEVILDSIGSIMGRTLGLHYRCNTRRMGAASQRGRARLRRCSGPGCRSTVRRLEPPLTASGTGQARPLRFRGLHQSRRSRGKTREANGKRIATIVIGDRCPGPRHRVAFRHDADSGRWAIPHCHRPLDVAGLLRDGESGPEETGDDYSRSGVERDS